MDNIKEMKQTVERLTVLGNRMRGLLTKFSGHEGEMLREEAKQKGKKAGIGAAISVFGVSVIAVASVYVIAVIILLVNIALDRLWLSALIVVFGSILFGAVVAVVGASIIRKSVKEIPKVGGDVIQQVKDTGEEMKKAAEEMQNLAKQEAQERQKQARDLMGSAKQVVPVVIAAYIGYRVVKKVVQSRREKQALMMDLE